MKTFSEYLVEKEIKRKFRSVFELQEYAIEMYYNVDSGIILEEYGVFKGAIKLAEYCESVIKNNWNEIVKNKAGHSITVTWNEYVSSLSENDLPCLQFFDAITFNCSINNKILKTCGVYTTSKFDDKLGYFSTIDIQLEWPGIFWKSITGDIVHELTHAYNDAITKIKKVKIDFEHFLVAHNYDDLSSSDKDNTPLEEYMRLALYYAVSYEQNAFFAQLRLNIYDLVKKHKIDNPHVLYNLAKTIDIYRGYQNFIELFTKSNIDKDAQNELIDAYIKYMHLDPKTTKRTKIWNKLKRTYQNIDKKIHTLIAKACCEEINSKHIIK